MNASTERLADFLRDFADANADSFEPEQIEHLKRAAIAIDDLAKERDEARIEVCTLSGNGSCDSTEREAESRGWKYLFVSEDSDA